MSEYTNGHRKRLKEKYANESNSLHDYELLELLLTYSIPRKDVKPTAKDLIKHFGNFENVFNATQSQLMKVNGIGENSATLISLFNTIGDKINKNRNANIKELNNSEEAKEYFVNLLKSERNEKVAVLSLDNSNHIISCRVISEGTVNLIDVSPRKIVEAVITDNASNVIIAHNHPFGDSEPSAKDVDFTLKTRDLLRPLGVELFDHIIIGENDAFSMRSSLRFVHYFKTK